MVLNPRHLLLILLAMAGALTQAQGHDPADIAINQTETGRLWLATRINDFTGKMLVDTGSSGSVLDQKYLPRIGKYKAISVDKGWGIGAKESHIANLTIEVGSFQVAGESTAKTHISVHENVIPDPELIGIIGIDAIQALRSGMQFSAESIILTNHYQAKNDRRQSTAMALKHSSLGMMYVEVEIEGQQVGLIIDSGADYTLINSDSLGALKLESKVLKGAYTSDINGNRLAVRQVNPTNIAMNGNPIRFSKLLAVPLSSAIQNQSFSTNVVGVIGLYDLKRLKAYLDFDSAKLHIQHGAR
ncbi:hypothetical protein GCM10011369_27400 [Neiella marina]|uniref:Peptidase A2 domain-containing protein n=1 Tax=Neiella marina TaxID=508461 RepID=A0A8J2U792_9GAMM|nr:hypothetical protein [Neiella marina]GGA83905.1 hypothetical protein GCM10011369_27400 [Neiella marina]